MLLRAASNLTAIALIALPLASQDIQAARNDKPGGPTVKIAEIVEPGDSVAEQLASSSVAPRAPRVRMELARYAAPMVSFKPERLAPGERGEAIIVLALQKKAVLATTANIQLRYEENQGPLGFGTWSIDPAKEAEIESFYKGQRVHDNFAIIRIPVRVSPQAKVASFRAAFRIEANVSAGDSGHDQGRFGLSTNGKLMIGRSIPRPIVRMPEVSEAKSSHTVSAESKRPVGAVADAVAPASRAGVMAVAADYNPDESRAADATASPSELDGLDPYDTDGGFDWLIFGAPIGLLLIGLIALIARKR